jgi:hypothetical protein
MRKNISNLLQLINNYSNYNYIVLYDPKIINIKIERLNFKYIYIYYIDRNTYDYLFLYNKSNKFYRLMIRTDKTTTIFTLVNDFFDTKVKDYFLFSDFEFIQKDNYSLSKEDIDIIDILKKIDN